MNLVAGVSSDKRCESPFGADVLVRLSLISSAVRGYVGCGEGLVKYVYSVDCESKSQLIRYNLCGGTTHTSSPLSTLIHL